MILIKAEKITNPDTLKSMTVFVTTDTGPVWKARNLSYHPSDIERVNDLRSYCLNN